MQKKSLLDKYLSQRVHVAIWYIPGPESRYMGNPLGSKYIPYTYMDPLGICGVATEQAPFRTGAQQGVWNM